MSSQSPIVIAGGGVGGLTAALTLARIGRATLVLERAPAFREVGAGLQLAPNATRILRELGVLEHLTGLAVSPAHIRIRRGRDGADLAKISLADAEKRYGAPYLSVHRADLLSALLLRAYDNRLIQIRSDAALTGFLQDERGVAVTYRSSAGEQRRASGDALIGADGVRSLVRRRMQERDADRPAYTGHTAWRTLLPASELSEPFRRAASNLWMGERAHLVHYPLRGGSVVNVVALVEDAWRGDGEDDPKFWDHEGDWKFLANRFKDWAPEARELMRPGDSWMRWPLFDRPPLDSFARGRVALLGDAAHPMVPYLAQGAAQAIEDAAALARAFADSPDDSATALAAYTAARRDRATRIQAASRAQGDIYHLAGFKAFARDMVLRASGSSRLLARQDWIYSA